MPPLTTANPAFAISVGRGAFSFPTGTWTHLQQTVKLNTFAANGSPNLDGELTVVVDGTTVIRYTKMIWLTDASYTFRGINFQTFFGGETDDWSTPTDQFLLFRNLQMRGW